MRCVKVCFKSFLVKKMMYMYDFLVFLVRLVFFYFKRSKMCNQKLPCHTNTCNSLLIHYLSLSCPNFTYFLKLCIKFWKFWYWFKKNWLSLNSAPYQALIPVPVKSGDDLIQDEKESLINRVLCGFKLLPMNILAMLSCSNDKYVSKLYW